MVRYQLHHHFDGDDDDSDDGEEKNRLFVSPTASQSDGDMMEIDEIPSDDAGGDDESAGGYDDSVDGEGGDGEQDNGTSNALSTYQSMTSLGSPAIQEHHYHFYYTPPPEYYNDHDDGDDDGMGRSSSCCGVGRRLCCRVLGSWWFIAILALGGQIIYNYGPPAAPPQPLAGTSTTLSSAAEETVLASWPEFWNNQSDLVGTLFKTWGLQLPAHIFYWCWQGMRNDFVVRYFPSVLEDDTNLMNQQCRWQQQFFQGENANDLSSHQLRIQRDLKHHVVGQDPAIDMVLQNLMTGKGPSSTRPSAPPVLLYLTGGVGVGKTHLAQTLSRLVFSSPTGDSHDSYDGCTFEKDVDDHPVLMIQSTDHSEDANEANVIRRIKDHANRSATSFGGAVVILTHVEKLHPGVFARLVQQLKSGRPLSSSSADSIATDHPPPNLLVIFTSNVGARVIHKTIQMYGGFASIPPLELRSLLAYQVDLFHGASGYTEISTMFDVIVPFFPLGKTELELILREQLQEHVNSLQLHRNEHLQRIHVRPTRPAIEAWLQHLEFHTWLQKSTVREILTFSPTGAKPVQSSGALVSSISSHLMNNCLLENTKASNTELVVYVELEKSAHDDDNDDGSDRGLQKFGVYSCATPTDDDRDQNQQLHTTAGKSCQKQCHFLL